MGFFSKWKKADVKPMRTFEDKIMEQQKDMLSICLEYSNEEADNIYIYCSMEEGAYSVGYFFAVNNRVFSREKLSEAIKNVDDSGNAQGQVLDILMKDLLKLNSIFKADNQKAPTEIKLKFDVKNNKFNAEYRYDSVITGNTDITSTDIEEEWMNEIENILKK